MSSHRNTKEKQKLYLKIIAICVLALATGYYMVEHISVLERPILGRTFYIITGCLLIAVAAILLFMTFKKILMPKKKRKGKSGNVFLDKDYKTKL